MVEKDSVMIAYQNEVKLQVWQKQKSEGEREFISGMKLSACVTLVQGSHDDVHKPVF